MFSAYLFFGSICIRWRWNWMSSGCVCVMWSFSFPEKVYAVELCAAFTANLLLTLAPNLPQRKESAGRRRIGDQSSMATAEKMQLTAKS